MPGGFRFLSTIAGPITFKPLDEPNNYVQKVDSSIPIRYSRLPSSIGQLIKQVNSEISKCRFLKGEPTRCFKER